MKDIYFHLNDDECFVILSYILEEHFSALKILVSCFLFHVIANEYSSDGLNKSKNGLVAANNEFLRGRVSVCVSNVYDVDS